MVTSVHLYGWLVYDPYGVLATPQGRVRRYLDTVRDAEHVATCISGIRRLLTVLPTPV